MYGHILVAIEHSDADRVILGHVVELARLTRAKLLLVHVADGWAARAYDELQLRESEEMKEDRDYLDRLREELAAGGFQVEWRLAMGDPASEIVRIAAEARVDLIAMATHGHKFLNDLIHGTTVDRVRHDVGIPVLLLRAGKGRKQEAGKGKPE